MDRRGVQLGILGGVVAAAGLYEAISDPLGWPSITQHGERYPELAGAALGALFAHFAASITRAILRQQLLT